jgi:hypothetical protein
MAPTDEPALDGGAAPSDLRAAAATVSLKGAHRLVVKLRGTGSVTGRVVSKPPGIDCEIVSGASNTNGPNEKQCEAKLPAGSVTLTFFPTGATFTGEFSFEPKHEICASKADGRNLTCSFSLDRELQVDVFPISGAPPKPRH